MGKEGFGFGSDFGFGWEEGVRLHRGLGAEDGRLVGRLVDLGFGSEGGTVGSWALLHLHHQDRGLQTQPHRKQLQKRKLPKAGY